MREREVFDAALAMTDPAKRSAFLDQACASDGELRQHLAAMLEAHEKLGNFLEVAPHRLLDQTLAQPDGTKPGAVIAGRYKLLEAIGEGGMGTVWVAEQTEPVRRKVALKLIKAGMDSKSVLARFEAERQALAVMDHPNIAKVLDGGLTELGRPFFVMEYVKGVPITEYCDASRLSVPQRLELFAQVCQAVQHAHQKGIIHRDLKPSNILVAPYDDKAVPKVIDFGLAKAMHQSLTERTLHTAHETVLGTPLYMSPEQAQLNNLDVDTRSDIYSLGVLLYELLTGSTPLEKQRFKEGAWDEIKRIIREEEPPRPSLRLSSSTTLPSLAAGRQTEPARLTKAVRGELDWIVMKALEKDRTRRYETASGFAADVERYLAGEPVQAAPPSVRYRLRKFAHKHRTALSTAAMIGLLLFASLAISVWQAVRATHAEADARQAEQQARIAEQQARRAEEAEAERAEAERLAKQKAEANENLANERLVQVEAEKKKAEDEKKIAQAVKDFLQKKLLAQADSAMQADALLKAGESSSEAKLDPTIRELLDRAAKELSADKIEKSFPQQPLVQAEILQTVGNSYHAIGESQSAIEFLKRSDALRRQHLGLKHPDTLTGMHDLALAYLQAGNWDLALPLLKETLELRRDLLGTEHFDTITSVNDLGVGYYTAGKPDLAVPLYEEAFKLHKATLGAGHSDTLASMGGLALAYRDTGRLDQAVSLLEEAMKLAQTHLGPEHPVTLMLMNNLGTIYLATRKTSLAVSLFEESFRLKKTKLGPDHPDTLVSMSNLAEAYLRLRRFELGLPLSEEAFKLSKARLGPEHPRTLSYMHNLANDYKVTGKLDLALRLHEETLKLRTTKLGPDHVDTLASMDALAYCHWRAKQLDKSIPMYAELLNLRDAKLGRDHPDTQRTVGNLGINYKDAGRLAEAIPLLEEAYRAGKQHPNLRVFSTSLLDAYAQAGADTKIAELLQEMLDEARSTLPKDSSQLASKLAQIGWQYQTQKQWAEAQPLFRESLAIWEKTQPELWSTFNMQSLLGGVLLRQKKYADAEPLLLSGYEGMKQREDQILKQSKVCLVEAVDRLIEFYTATDKPEEANKWQAERAKYPPPAASATETK